MGKRPAGAGQPGTQTPRGVTGWDIFATRHANAHPAEQPFSLIPWGFPARLAGFEPATSCRLSPDACDMTDPHGAQGWPQTGDKSNKQQKLPVLRSGGFLETTGLFGAEDGIRTRDLLLGKEMLYH